MSEVDLTSPLRTADVLTMPRAEALDKFKEYSAAVRRSQFAADRLLARTYRALADGHGVLNVPEAMRKAGVHAETTHLPKLAIMRADYEFAYFSRMGGGGGLFSFSERFYLSRRSRKGQAARQQFEFGREVFPEVEWDVRKTLVYYWSVWRAPLPIIPPRFRPADALSKYCLLWEVAPNGWTRTERPQPPSDPMLLRPLGQTGLYIVVAHWDLTPVERMILGGLLGS